MTPAIMCRIHAFRNALELAASTRSHECFAMGRWLIEMNNFPHGCCSLASNFLAQYLHDSDPELKPIVVYMETTPEFREKYHSTIISHSIVKLGNCYIDLTLNQFEEHRGRVMIDERHGTLHTLLNTILAGGGKVEESGIRLDTKNSRGKELYEWLRVAADGLLLQGGEENTTRKKMK